MKFSRIYGVDFSGARLAGRNTWVALIEPKSGGRRSPAYRLTRLSRLEQSCGTADRPVALAHLVQMIAESKDALWALDFPFGLPVEVIGPRDRWPYQFDLLREWADDDDVPTVVKQHSVRPPAVADGSWKRDLATAGDAEFLHEQKLQLMR